MSHATPHPATTTAEALPAPLAAQSQFDPAGNGKSNGMGQRTSHATNAARTTVFCQSSHEDSDSYRGTLLWLAADWRIAADRDGIQWLLQKRSGRKWRTKAFCRSKAGLHRMLHHHRGRVMTQPSPHGRISSGVQVPKLDPKDKSRSAVPKAERMRQRHTAPPNDEGGWLWITLDMLQSASCRSLSINARRCLDRLCVEHLLHGRAENGRLIVTHDNFREWGVTGDLVADAIDELAFKGLVAVQRGRQPNGTPWPHRYRLTWTGDHEGAPPTNEWKAVTKERCAAWPAARKVVAEKRAAMACKNKTPLREHGAAPLRKHGAIIDQTGRYQGLQP